MIYTELGQVNLNGPRKPSGRTLGNLQTFDLIGLIFPSPDLWCDKTPSFQVIGLRMALIGDSSMWNHSDRTPPTKHIWAVHSLYTSLLQSIRVGNGQHNSFVRCALVHMEEEEVGGRSSPKLAPFVVCYRGEAKVSNSSAGITDQVQPQPQGIMTEHSVGWGACIEAVLHRGGRDWWKRNERI